MSAVMANVPVSIPEAALMLDARVPGWYKRIVHPLVMESDDKCVLGQIYDDFEYGFQKLFEITYSDYVLASCVPGKSSLSAFSGRASKEDWLTEIQVRKINCHVDQLKVE